jgi:hypothetical protein
MPGGAFTLPFCVFFLVPTVSGSRFGLTMTLVFLPFLDLALPPFFEDIRAVLPTHSLVALLFIQFFWHGSTTTWNWKWLSKKVFLKSPEKIEDRKDGTRHFNPFRNAAASQPAGVQPRANPIF